MTKRINIKLRRDILSPERIHKHKNYSSVLREYARKKRYDRAVRLFKYSLVVAAITLFLVLGVAVIAWVIKKMESEKAQQKKDKSAQIEWIQRSGFNSC